MVDWREVEHSQEWHDWVQKAFEAFDVDGSGSIGIKDLQDMLCQGEICTVSQSWHCLRSTYPFQDCQQMPHHSVYVAIVYAVSHHMPHCDVTCPHSPKMWFALGNFAWFCACRFQTQLKLQFVKLMC